MQHSAIHMLYAKSILIHIPIYMLGGRQFLSDIILNVLQHRVRWVITHAELNIYLLHGFDLCFIGLKSSISQTKIRRLWGKSWGALPGGRHSKESVDLMPQYTWITVLCECIVRSDN